MACGDTALCTFALTDDILSEMALPTLRGDIDVTGECGVEERDDDGDAVCAALLEGSRDFPSSVNGGTAGARFAMAGGFAGGAPVATGGCFPGAAVADVGGLGNGGKEVIPLRLSVRFCIAIFL